MAYCGDPAGYAFDLTSPIQYDAGTGEYVLVSQDFPRQFWSDSTNTETHLTLSCPSSSGVSTTATPAITYVSTQAPVPVNAPTSLFLGSPQDCATPTDCNQIILQSAQMTEAAGASPWSPGLPLKIVGSGFGYYGFPSSSSQNAGLPSLISAGTVSPNLTISHCPAGNFGGGTCSTYDWTTANRSGCQLYLTNWTDTSISVVLGLKAAIENVYETENSLSQVLSPLSDLTPADLPAGSQCVSVSGDYLFFAITNPQSSNSNSTFYSIVTGAGIAPSN